VRDFLEISKMTQEL